jgi:hypothetical protein
MDATQPDAFSTNDPTTFGFGFTTIGGHNYHGVTFLKDGVYYCTYGFAFVGCVSGDVLRMESGISGGGAAFSNLQGSDQGTFPSPGFANAANLGFIEGQDVNTATGFPAPTDPLIFAVRDDNNSGGHALMIATFQYLGSGTFFP